MRHSPGRSPSPSPGRRFQWPPRATRMLTGVQSTLAGPLAVACLAGILSRCLLVKSEEECLFSRIWCYECDTVSDFRCKDPFNATAHPQDLPTLKRCEGCCVKIVMNQAMPNEVVRRTCTSNLQINLFLVDHVCMLESEGHGLMCFCESDACNGSSRHWQTPLLLFLYGAFFLVQFFKS